jgi:DNA-nicking Smr family endonuclease
MSENYSPFNEPVVLPIGDVLDLHSFKAEDVPSVVEEYLKECRRSGILQVRLIHGKGSGVQRAIIRSFLEKNPDVISFEDASAEVGSWGATIVRLLVQ